MGDVPMSKYTYSIEGEPKFRVTQETREYPSPWWFHNASQKTTTVNYDKIEWGEWWAEIYTNERIQILHQHGGDDWLRMNRDEIPGLIAMLIMIYTNEYKK